ncbi:MAG: PilZ domain-containing protein [Sedimenticola sp.]|nr:PilZ domain-containing protein [Sedimenticola sp.]
MVPSADNREHPRFALRSHVQLTDAEGRVRQVYTRDLSHSGLYLLVMDEPLPAVDEEVEVVALDIEDPLPQRAVVVRVEPGTGVAIKFL